MKTQEHVIRWRQNHHQALADLRLSIGGPDEPGMSGLAVWRNLRRIEAKASHAACQYCNGEIGHEQWEIVQEATRTAVEKLFGGPVPGFFVNGDPRGYALKLEEKSVPFDLHRDFGGYQILAPEIN